MRLLRSWKRTQLQLAALKRQGKRIAFVPTMGALHAGHLSLVQRARKLGDTLVVSVFVNPTQFAPSEDFSRYPRNLIQDKKLLKANAVDILFAPETAALYPEDFDTYVTPGRISQRLEGEFRPVHFRGVVTIVLKLFNIIQPDAAVFGEKDLQQSLVIEQMVRDLNLPVAIVVAPTVRDHDGLALSSRNAYLGDEGRKRATVIPVCLFAAREMVRGGERRASRVRAYIRRRLEREARAEIDYVSVADRRSLSELKEISGEVTISLACRIAGVRLIDNVTLKV